MTEISTKGEKIKHLATSLRDNYVNWRFHGWSQ